MKDRCIVVAVTGGIAAYKSATLVSRLAQAGARVHVTMTEAATQFVGHETFAALSGRHVSRKIFEGDRYPLGAHIELAESAELLCVAPATANFLAKAAHGLADDLVTTLYLAYRGPILVAPAMSAEMWEHPAVRRNVDQLKRDGVEMVGPGKGWLSCRREGAGRMAEPEEILAVIRSQFPSAGDAMV